MSRRRNLSDEEQALWVGYARSIKPLKPVKTAHKRDPGPGRASVQAALQKADQEARASPQTPVRRDPAPVTKSAPLAPFDRRLKQRVARGRDAIDARIDLHGMTQQLAHRNLSGWLAAAHRRGHRLVLVVTGKGNPRNDENAPWMMSSHGVLKLMVPRWLNEPELAALIANISPAHARHGGDGALYVYLRK
jgi:DNA-nicking Smr family endonuclease